MVKRTDEATKLTLKVVTGQTEAGDNTYSSRNFSKIDPEADDASLYSVGNGLGSLQSHTVGFINRTDTATLVPAE